MKQMAQYQKSVAVTTLWIAWELEQEDEEEQENKEVGGSEKGENVERGADAEMAGVWVQGALFCLTLYFPVLFSITSITTRIEMA